MHFSRRGSGIRISKIAPRDFVLAIVLLFVASCRERDSSRLDCRVLGFGLNGRHIVYLDMVDIPADLALAALSSDERGINATTTIPFDYTRYEPFQNAASVRKAVQRALARRFAAYDIDVVLQRPSSGVFTTCVVGRDSPNFVNVLGASVGGAAVVDCENSRENDIVFARQTLPAALPSAERLAIDAEDIATACAHELGHSFGLQHSTDPLDVMYSSPRSDSHFTDGPRSVGPGAGHCGSGTARQTQDDHLVLSKSLGLRSSELDKPSDIAVNYPSEKLEAPAEIELTGELRGAVAGSHVDLYSNGAFVGATGNSFSYLLRVESPGAINLSIVGYPRSGLCVRKNLTLSIADSASRHTEP